jgi:sugar phosphate isomerase/epimerase
MSSGRQLSTDDLVLCAGTVRPAPFREKVDAASANGFQGLSLYVSDYEQARRDGWSDAAIRRLLGDRGVAVAELDGRMDWLGPVIGTADPSPDGRTVEQFLSAAEAIEARSVTALEVAGRRVGRDIAFDAAAEAFARLCDHAAGAGLLVHIEYFPWSGIPDIGTAYEVTRRAGRSNGGVMVDVWHHVRGPDAGSLELDAPGPAVLAVQVGDVLAEPGPSVRHEAMHQRLLPGEGAGSVAAILRALRQQGCAAPMEVEVYSDRLAALPAVEAARLAGDALRGVLADAGLR